MSLNAKNAPGGGKRPDPIEAGSYPARLVQVISLGIQPQEYQGEAKEPRVELYLTYELLDEFMKDEEGNDLPDKPRWLSERVTLHNLASEKAKSTARYLALDPGVIFDGDWASLVGTACMVTVIQNEGKGKNKGTIYNNVSAVSGMRTKDAEKAPPLVNPTAVFDPDEPDMAVYNKLPDWIKDVIKSGVDFEGSDLADAIDAAPAGGGDKDDWE